MAKSIAIDVKNTTGSTIASGKALYVSGYNEGKTIGLADCRYESTMPCVGVLSEDLLYGETGKIRSSGTIPYNTIGSSINAPVYVGFNGNLTFDDPIDSNANHISQQVGIVIVVGDYTEGQIHLSPFDIVRKHSKTHQITKRDEFKHATQHAISNDDPFIHASQHAVNGGDDFIHSRQHTATGGDPITHAQTTNKDSDDHLHYILVNGTRAFTGVVGGITPTSDAHLTTKEYVDAVVGSSGIIASEAADGYLAIFTNPYRVFGDNDLYWDRINNRLGIHTMTPTKFLDVNGDANVTGVFTAGTYSGITWEQVDKSTSDIADITTKSHTSLTDIGTNAHSTIDSFISSKAQASGLASLDGSTLVVQNPANATATPTQNKIPIADGVGGTLAEGWIPDLSGTYAPLAGVSGDFTIGGDIINKDLLNTIQSIRQAVDGYAVLPSAAGSRGDGYVAFFSGSQATGAVQLGGDNDLYWDRTNNRLGIGTTTPEVKLDVRGNGVFRRNSSSDQIQLELGTDVNDRAVLYMPSSSSDLHIFSADSPINGYDKMVLTSGGKIGIIETAPASTLSVKGNATIGTNYSTSAALSEGLLVEGSVGLGYTSSTAKLSVNGSVSIGSSTANITNGLYSLGNVGINVLTPSEPLELKTTTDWYGLKVNQDTNSTNAAGCLTFYRTRNTGSAAADDRVGQVLCTIKDSAGATANVVSLQGITTNVTNGAVSGDWGFITSNSGSWDYRAILKSDGKFGILTTSPAAELDVNGNAIVRSDLTIGGDIINKDLRNTIQSIRQGCDGYQTQLNGLDSTEHSHYNAISNAIQAIRKDCDGYQTQLNGLDSTEHSHYNAMSNAVQTIRKDLDGYTTSTGTTGDGYLTFFTNTNKLAGDNDLYWDRTNNKLTVSGGGEELIAAPLAIWRDSTKTQGLYTTNDISGNKITCTSLITNAKPFVFDLETTGEGTAAGTKAYDWQSGGTSRMQLSDDGYFGLGSASLTGYSFRISKNISKAATSYLAHFAGNAQSDVLTGAYGLYTILGTQAYPFTLPELSHFTATQGTIGAGSVLTTQYGFRVGSSLTGAATNYGFYSNIAAGTNRWNFYANGNAQNYFAGNVLCASDLTIGGDIINKDLRNTFQTIRKDCDGYQTQLNGLDSTEHSHYNAISNAIQTIRKDCDGYLTITEVPGAESVLALNEAVQTIRKDLDGYAVLAGTSGGQTLYGGTASGDDLTLCSTSNATKGDVIVTSAANVWYKGTASGATSLSQTTVGVMLTAVGMNTSSKYTPALKFGSTDAEFTTTNPKWLAGLVGRCTETYSGDTDAGMALDFLTTNINAGATPIPETTMTLDDDGGLFMNGASGSSKGLGTINAQELYTNGLLVPSIVSIDAYGASPDATAATNTTAFTNAIASGRAVYVPAGSYLLNKVSINRDVRIYGDGYASKLIRPSNYDQDNVALTTANLPMFDITAHGVDVQFENLAFDGREANQNVATPSAMFIRANALSGGIRTSLRVSVRNCTFFDQTSASIYIRGLTSSNERQILTVDGCTFLDGRPGIGMSDPRSSNANGFTPACIILDGHVEGTISNSTFLYRKTLSEVNPLDYGPTAIWLLDNATQVNANGASVRVSNNYFYGYGRNLRKYDASDTPLDYNNALGVVDYYARGREMVVSGNKFENFHSAAVRGKSNCELVTIANNTLTNGETGITINPAYVAGDTQDGYVSITGNVIKESDRWGICVGGASDVEPVNINSVVIANNVIQDTTNTYNISDYSGGILVYKVDNALINSNIVQHAVDGNLRGIQVRYAVKATVSNNIVENVTYEGINYVACSDKAVIVGNTVKNCVGNGIAVNAWVSSPDVICANNMIDNVADYGIVINNGQNINLIGNMAFTVSGEERGFYVPAGYSRAQVVGNCTDATNAFVDAGSGATKAGNSFA